MLYIFFKPTEHVVYCTKSSGRYIAYLKSAEKHLCSVEITTNDMNQEVVKIMNERLRK